MSGQDSGSTEVPTERLATRYPASPRKKRRAAKRRPKAVRRKGPRKAARGNDRAARAAKGRRFSPAERRRILAAARRDSLTGAQVAKRFGVSTVTYYAWRKKAGTTRRTKRRMRQGKRPGSIGIGLVAEIRRELREQIGKILPDIIRSEIGLAIGGSARRRR